jgi:hypothetical protein
MFVPVSFNSAGSFYGLEKRSSSTFRSSAMRAGAHKAPARGPGPALAIRRIWILRVSHEWMVNEQTATPVQMQFEPVILRKNGLGEAWAVFAQAASNIFWATLTLG